MQSEEARVDAFSDGVFAIAITLLILEIKIPKPDQGHLVACFVVALFNVRASVVANASLALFLCLARA
jgi:uncharacterized membrane protein